MYTSEQPIQQLEPRKGGYFYLTIEAERVEKMSQKRATRLVCILENSITIHCGLNHLGDGNFFIIIAGRYAQELGKNLGDSVRFSIHEDPNPLGIAMPEALEALLEQEPFLKKTFETLTDGKKRSVMVAVSKIKNVDKQIQTAMDLLNNPSGIGKKKERI
jgi:Bacteriocin-protection, YdeI or OmpD-Associated